MAERPHVLLVSTDHWPAALLGCAGHPSIQTPTLDALARSGTHFTNCYAECPVCIPARRTLMTGTTPRFHGDRVYNDSSLMPDVPSLAQTFRNHGYQAYAVGKLHVYPQRDRIGFDDVILDEEGRIQFGAVDDYETFLADRGFAGQQFAHGMSNNQYSARNWHLPEDTHVTTWATRQMARTIRRRDPKRPGFWFLSYRHPHPPLTPLAEYMEMYRDVDIEMPTSGTWTEDAAALPHRVQVARHHDATFFNADLVRTALKAFYALCTHIDHQLRYVIGTLREEGLLNNTVICFTSDHGDMLGRHGMWAKSLFYEGAANIPMLLVGAAGDERVKRGAVDHKLVGWRDVMPTLLDLAGVPVPEHVEGQSMAGAQTRDYVYCEIGEGRMASRMIRTAQHKLIYYPVGNRAQLFDLDADPHENTDLAGSAAHKDVLQNLTAMLIGELYRGDEAWVQDGKLVGLPHQTFTPGDERALSGVRGDHWPPFLPEK